jgi:double-strand break repair protein AddB
MARPALFALPPGVDFPAELVAGLLDRHGQGAPEDLARVTLIVNTGRMARRVTECLAASGARLFPRILLVTDVARLSDLPPPPPVPPLRRRLQLAVLLDRLLASGRTHFAQSALYDLADSLATLLAEMQGEGVAPDRIAALDVADHSAHWARTQAFLGIAAEALASEGPDAEGLLRQTVLALAAAWQLQPPGPVVLAGSTGSRGTTALLLQAVAGLPEGAVVLPGFDFDLPAPVWAAMDDALTAEDHPQFRFRRITQALDLDPGAVQRWTGAPPPDSARNRLISLSLRPAPITDQWLAEGPGLGDLVAATHGLSLIEAPGERAEALAIALVLREAAEAGTRAALISPDRVLARRVTAALDRWGIRPDDSAGRPLPLSAPGRLLRQVAELFAQRLTGDRLLALLKHPLVFSGSGRGPHLLFTRELELALRRDGPAYPTAESLAAWAARSDLPGAEAWAATLGQALAEAPAGALVPGRLPLAEFVARHLAVAQALARGLADQGSGGLWDQAAGAAALQAMGGLQAEAPVGGDMTAADYAALVLGVLQSHEVRETESLHPGIMIWGTLEARVQGAELVILGGLNDGTWPAQPAADPWLNRAMRQAAGLLLPERQIGLSAHDYTQAIAAPRVILSRARRGAEAETVPSRWLNRLVNLMAGLPKQQGPQALDLMRARGQVWLDLAAAVEAAPTIAPARRPSPRPPVAARPRRLSVTEVKTLIRDPFAIYARHVLGLRPLDPVRPEADPRLRGVVLHQILEHYLAQGGGGRAALLANAEAVLDDRVAWPLARALWRARIAKMADAFLAFSDGTGGVPVLLEEKGAVLVPGQDFTLTGKPDRIDRLPDGRLFLIDYKTGTPPTQPEQEKFDKQLFLLAAMAEAGGFRALGRQPVARLAYVSLKAGQKPTDVPLAPDTLARVWADFGKLVATYGNPRTGYTARRAMQKDRDASDYDHLSRLGEWDMTDDPWPEDLA